MYYDAVLGDYSPRPVSKREETEINVMSMEYFNNFTDL